MLRWLVVIIFILIIFNIVKVVVLPELKIIIAYKLIFKTMKSLLCKRKITLNLNASGRTAHTHFLRKKWFFAIRVLF